MQEIFPIPAYPGFEILKVDAALNFDNVPGLDSVQDTLWGATNKSKVSEGPGCVRIATTQHVAKHIQMPDKQPLQAAPGGRLRYQYEHIAGEGVTCSSRLEIRTGTKHEGIRLTHPFYGDTHHLCMFFTFNCAFYPSTSNTQCPG